MDTNLDKRMYSLVLYQLSGIQAGIQSGHSNSEYETEFGEDLDYKDWSKKRKTVILLNGGTSNSGKESYYEYPQMKGSMETHLETLLNNTIKVVPFYEPDLNYCMTSLSFLVDERVFDTKKYPDFNYEEYYLFPINNISDYQNIYKQEVYFNGSYLESKKDFDIWLDNIGGESNFFLRLFTKQFKLASN